MGQDHGGNLFGSYAFSLQLFQQVARSRRQPVCAGIDEDFLFSGFHQKTGIRSHDLIQREVVITKTIFQLFFRRIRENPLHRVENVPSLIATHWMSPMLNDSLLDTIGFPLTCHSRFRLMPRGRWEIEFENPGCPPIPGL